MSRAVAVLKRLDPRYRPHVALALAAFVTSFAIHAAATRFAPAAPVAALPLEATTSDLDFFEVEAPEPVAAPAAPPEAEAKPEASRPPRPARRPAARSESSANAPQSSDDSSPRLILTRPTASPGVFGFDQRLSIGEDTPRIVPTRPRVRPTPQRPIPPPQVQQQPTQTDEEAAPEEALANATPVDESDASTPDVAVADAGTEEPRPRVPRARPAALVQVVDLPLTPSASGRERLSTATIHLDEVDLSLLLGLDRAVVDRVVRHRAAADSPSSVALRTTLTPADMRSRIVGAFAARQRELRFVGPMERAVARVSHEGKDLLLVQLGSSIAVSTAPDEAALEPVLQALLSASDGYSTVSFEGVEGSEGRPKNDLSLRFRVDGSHVNLLVAVTPRGERPEQITSLLAETLEALRLSAIDVAVAHSPAWNGETATFDIVLTNDAGVRFASRLAAID